jgi:hypothetical protein
MGRSFVLRSPTECGVSEYDRGNLTVRRRRPSTGVELWRGGGINRWIVYLPLG